MNYQSPVIDLSQKSDLTRDEYWPILVVLFIVWAYNQYELNRAIASCENQGGVASVESYFFGTVWKVTCYK